MKRFILAGIAALISLPAIAQDLPGDIVITGRTDANRKTVQRFVADISVRSESQLARFHQPICPVVIGLPRPYSTTIEKRILVAAAEAGVPVANKAKCSPNFIVIIAESGSDLVRDIRIHRPGWLAGLEPAEIDKLIDPAPARAWSVTSLRNEDGEGLRTPSSTAGTDGLAGKPILRVMSASIIKQPMRQDMEASFVLLDKASTMGLTLRQLADYAAMRGLAHTRPPAAGGAIDTILSLFDSGAPARARGLTAADSAYLRALYKSPGTDAAVTERNAIARRISEGK